jgi:hypothetical protein
VNLFVSTNGGDIWKGPLTKVTGDVGAKIASGSRNITWKVLEEFEELRGDKIQFQVRAFGVTIKTVKIGTQEWAKKNLDVSTYRNGDVIPEVKDEKEWSTLTTGAWCYYNNNPNEGVLYGKLYNWYAVNDPRGLVPDGFHIPRIYELEEINNLKDATGFAGLAGGYRDSGGKFPNFGNYGYWWSSSENNTMNAFNRFLSYNSGIAISDNNNKTSGLSVRCLKD